MLSPGTTIDRYVVEAPLGEGGMAQVYRVRHTALGTLHALKVLTLIREDVKARFLQEGRLQATLRHPNIVSVSDVLEFEGQTALLLEYVDGPTLSTWVRDAPRDLSVVERLFREVVAGVSCAHERGLVHRDLKPANVLLARTADGWTAKVADFGLAKIAGDASNSVTRSNIAMGTPSYMAPEQIRNAKRVDARADIYGLGCILYEMICRRPPYSSDDLVTLLQAVVSGEYAPPETFSAGLPARFSATIREAMQLDPDRRPPDCRTLLAVLTTGERPLDDVRSTEILLPPVPVTLVAASDAPSTFDPTPAGPDPVPVPVPLPVPESAPPAAPAPVAASAPASVVRAAPAAPRAAFAGLMALFVLAAGAGGVTLLAAGAWWAFSGEEQPTDATIAAAPAASTVPACVPGGEGRIGWVKVEQRSFGYSTTWSSGRPRNVYAELPSKANDWNEGAAPVCALAEGANLRLSEKHELARAWWVALDADGFTIDGSPAPAGAAKASGSSSGSTSPRSTAPRSTPAEPAEPAPEKKPRQGEKNNPLDDIEEGIEAIEEIREKLPQIPDNRRRLDDEG